MKRKKGLKQKKRDALKKSTSPDGDGSGNKDKKRCEKGWTHSSVGPWSRNSKP